MSIFCCQCGKRIFMEKQAVVLTYVANGKHHRQYLCRVTGSTPGCAEDMLGLALPELLGVSPFKFSQTVIQFPYRPPV